MISIHLQVDEEYIETFMMTLPKEHVIVVEKDFEENKILLKSELKEYHQNNEAFIPYQESMNNISAWLDVKSK